ncbi:MAG: hypothetical protein KGL46_13145 [Hyphomicrobiales bacterium]|nr:hypothetical protein [Hyphomicrobiales bacterium]
MSEPRTIEIFRAGTHKSTDGVERTFSEGDLQQIAAGYDKQVFEAPVVIGHPKINEPAWGWVDTLVVVGLVLRATLRDVDADFAEVVKAGRYKKISASLYEPGAHNNPKPGRWYLRHVGFLGAVPPAVKGLQSVAFGADAAGVVTFGAFDEGETIAAYKAEIARLKGVSFVEQQVRAGRLLPRHAEGAVAFMEEIASAGGTVSFADDGEKISLPPVEWFKRFVSEQPRSVTYGLTGIKPFERPGETDSASFAAPRDYAVAPENIGLHEEIQQEAAKRKIPYAEALKIVARRQRGR